MKEGLLFENGELIYYKHGQPYHAGVIESDGAIYYINSKGRAVKGEHIVHREMTNGILKRGTYTFGEDYRLIKGSYVAPKKNKKTRRAAPAPTRRSKQSAKVRIKRMAYIGAALLALTLLLFLGTLMQNMGPVQQAVPEADPKVVLPSFEEDVLLCTPAAKAEYDGAMPLAEAAAGGNPYCPFLFSYHFTESSGILLLSEQETLENAKEYVLHQDAQFVAIDNLKTDTTYYYNVIVDGTSYPGSFHTARATRFVSIPGLYNTRDIGGYTTLDGKTIRQGLLIRGTELDGLGNPQFLMEASAAEMVQETFGFVYDLDLRSPSLYAGDYVSPLGHQVGHRFYKAPMYGEIFSENYYPALQAIFTDLANPENYPMYLHCTWGRDRAGTIVFLLQGVLNVPEQDMVREYQRTAYAYDTFDAANSQMDVIIQGLAPYTGRNLNERIVSFLISEIGITQEQIDSIRSIFLY